MDAKRETKRILEALDRYRKSLGWGSSGALDRKLKRHEGYVARIMSGQMAMRLELLLEAVGVLGFEAGEFFAWVYGDECRISPKRYLLDLEKKAAPNALLRQVDIVLATCLEKQHRETQPSSTMLDRVRQLEDLRFSFPLRAREEGEVLLRAISPESDSVDALAFCEVLAALGSVERALDQFSLAAAYLRRALELAETHGLVERKGDLLLRCCNLVADQGDLSIALALASQAREVYTLQHNLSGIGKSLVDEGILHRKNGAVAHAIRCFESSLQYLPQSEWRCRVTVHYGLAVAALQQGQLNTCKECLDRAYTEHQAREGYSWDKMAWLRGELAFARGNLVEAETALLSVRGVLTVYGNAVDVALVSLRLCQVLLLSGRVPEMMALISEMVELLQPLRGHSIAEATMNSLLKEALVGKVTMDSLDRAYKQLEQSIEQV